MDIREHLQKALEMKASDLFLVAGLPASARVGNTIHRFDDNRLMPADTAEAVSQIYELAGHRSLERLEHSGDDDFSFAIPGMSRFRVNTFKQRGTLSAVIRLITFTLPDPAQLGIPQNIIEMGRYSKGMVLVTGPAGSGKSTTLACMIDHINHTEMKHIITLEDPIEYLHRHNMSIVSQREINVDTENYVTALRAALRQSPDVILLGEMRDFETMQVAMTAAETGHLLISTLHTVGSANTIDRIIDVFPPSQQRQVAVQLSMLLKAVISQQLIPARDGSMVPAFEIMTVTPAIRNMIRENKIPQIDGIVYSSNQPDMIAMDTSLLKLYQSGQITKDTALTYATNPDMLGRKLH